MLIKKLPEIPDASAEMDLGAIFQSLADFQTKRETKQRALGVATQNSLNKINELANLAWTHRESLLECGFLKPMQGIMTGLIMCQVQSLEAQSEQSHFLFQTIGKIEATIREAVNDGRNIEKPKQAKNS